MTQATAPAPDAQKRSKWLYGSNLAILVIIAVVIIAMAMVVTAQVKKKWDLTGNGAYSLSGYTKQLLKQLDEKKGSYEVINAFRPSDDRQQQVQDILDEYARASNNITVEDLTQVSLDQIVQKIEKRYQGELKPYDDVITQYHKISTDVENFLKAEGANLGAVAQQPGADQKTQQVAAQLQGLFSSQMPEMLAAAKRKISRSTESTTPDYPGAVSTMKATLNEALQPIDALSDPKKVSDLTPPLVKYLTNQQKSYEATAKEIKNFTDKIDKLPPLKVTDVLNNLAPGTVVIIGPTSATVVAESAIYKAPADENPQSQATFQGEQAISSALLPMINPNKVKVVFINSTNNLHPASSTNEEGWSEMADRLRAVNFDVLEWSPPGPPQGPDQPPQPATPPAEGKGVVWIVFPPDPANPQMMMMGMPPPSPQPVIDAVKKHLDEGGQVLFLADASAGGMFGGGDTYPYEALLKPFGIDVQSKYTVVHDYPDQTGQHRIFSQILVNHYEDHAITKPLQALQTAFVGFPTRSMGIFGAPTVVSVEKSLPAGVDAHVLVESPSDTDTWAEATYSQAAPFNKQTDLAAPVPLAAAAEKNAGKDDAQRVVVIASRNIGANTVLDTADLRQNARGGIEPYFLNPGNAELVTNSVLWLGGYKNMIAVSPKSAAAERIRDIPAGMMTFIHWMLFFGIPLLALVLGGIVYFFRRR